MSVNSWIDRLSQRMILLWLVVFAYVLVIGLLLQLVLLPHVFPAWHWGHGLLKGMDGPRFHMEAVNLAAAIREHGWGMWEIRADGQIVSSVAAVFYVLIAPEPWTVLPLNAVLAATAAVYCVRMLDNLLQDRRVSLLASLPFIFFPSAILWNAQYHNENFAVPGVILILYAWSRLARHDAPTGLSSGLATIVPLLAGSLLLGLTRAYILFGVALLCGLVCAVLCGQQIARYARREQTLAALSGRLVYLGLAIVLMGTAAALYYRPRVPSADRSVDVSRPRSFEWEPTPWLPGFLDDQFKSIARDRGNLAHASKNSGSGIDLEIQFGNAGAAIAYVPRALQIGFLAPFPDLWFSEGRKAASGATRALSAAEMIVAYFCLLGLPAAMWTQRRRLALWTILGVCAGMILVYALTVPNIGSLYRFRFPFYLPVVCIGLSGLLGLWPAVRQYLRDRGAPGRVSSVAGRSPPSD